MQNLYPKTRLMQCCNKTSFTLQEPIPNVHGSQLHVVVIVTNLLTVICRQSTE